MIGVDGGNTKTELLAVSLEGEPLAHETGAGSNSHGLGAEGAIAVVAELVDRAAVALPVVHGAFFLCGADVPDDVAALTEAIARRGWAGRVSVDNDTVGLLWAGTDASDAVAVVCGAGINSVGRTADGRIARYPALGWETGDWGGSEQLGREALFLAARAEDRRGEPTGLVELVRDHFGAPSAASLGEHVHYGRVRRQRLGELAPAIVELAATDPVARRLVERLAGEIVLLAQKALRDLDLVGRPVDVVLGGGMLRGGEGFLHDAVLRGMRASAPLARPIVLPVAPVLGAALAALAAAGATGDAAARLRASFAGTVPA